MSDSVAVIAAHPDDEVLGCGGTIARLTKNGIPVHVLLMSEGETSRASCPEEVEEKQLTKRAEEALLAAEILGVTSLKQLGLPDNRMDQIARLDVIQSIESFIEDHHPKTVFTHHSGDVNIDHRVIHDAVMAACRPQPGFMVRELMFFEVPSSTEWRPPSSASMFNPNWFVDISETTDLKFQALQVYKSELRAFPHARSVKAIEALAVWRGASVGVAAAEAFILGRKILS